MPSSTRSNKKTHLLFSEDLAYLERSIRKDQRSTLLDAAAFTSTDSRTHPSTDTRPSSSSDPHRLTSIDPTPCTSIDPQSRIMVAIVILRQDENGNLYDQDGHLRNATAVPRLNCPCRLISGNRSVSAHVTVLDGFSVTPGSSNCSITALAVSELNCP
ncbi:hypothetical protein DY000_02052817 [Brassica cretica]|uniref:Uncharacterized protein n=1 Tax=Brassica cretica TaxID=69181 RepID=A0ABQ7AJI2_BRACR|nr:hypothetical protein DY000_02052817 [Brassica cretica]